MDVTSIDSQREETVADHGGQSPLTLFLRNGEELGRLLSRQAELRYLCVLPAQPACKTAAKICIATLGAKLHRPSMTRPGPSDVCTRAQTPLVVLLRVIQAGVRSGG